jgi:hypothetical protein
MQLNHAVQARNRFSVRAVAGMSMMAIEAREFGGPEVLTPISLPAPVPGPGEAVIAYGDTPLKVA